MKKVTILNQCSISGGDNREITIQRLSHYLERNQNLVFPHRHDFYHCVLFTQGEGSHQIDFENFEVESWQIYCMAPGQIHTWNFRGEMEGYVINFDSNAFKTLLLQSDYITGLPFFLGTAANAVFTLQQKYRSTAQSVLENLLSINQRPSFVKSSLFYFFELLTLHVGSTDEPTPTYGHTLLRNFIALLEVHYKMLRLPREYAKLLYITPHHLNALCKDMLGTSAGEVIRKRVLLEAKRLLAIRDYSIAEIAYLLNFRDNSYFTKFFKKAEQMTPEQFRANLTSI